MYYVYKENRISICFNSQQFLGFLHYILKNQVESEDFTIKSHEMQPGITNNF